MPKKKTINSTNDNPVDLEKASEAEAEAMAHHGSEASAEESADNPDEEAEKAAAAEEAADADVAVPAEIAAIHTDNETASSVNKKIEKKVESKAVKEKKASPRSKKYQEAKSHVEPGKAYSLTEALDLVKRVSVSKFDGSVEVHVKLAKKKSKGASESPKGIFNLPHGTGKNKKIIVLDEDKIEEIAKTKKIDFDIAIATPELMPKVGKVAKILGPKGKMPDPKSGTVTTDPKKAIEEINSGKVEYRVDAQNHIHQIIGKVSWDIDKLTENAKVVLAAFPKTRYESVYLTASISPSVQVDLSSL